MIEGAHIDKQSHLMDADRAVGETIEFDNAVGVAKRWADRLGDTVIVVLADHECSGFSLIGALAGGLANLKATPPDNSKFDPSSTPARQGKVGTYDAAGFPRYQINKSDGYPESMDIDGKLLFGFGADGDRFEGWLSKPLPIIDSLLPSVIKSELAAKGYSGSPAGRAEKDFGYFVRGQVPGDQAVHTASDIPVSAYSTGSQAWRSFTGVQTNTDVFFKLMRAALGSDADVD
jgi:alkaline phosphatase